jgi:hypothetical protein
MHRTVFAAWLLAAASTALLSAIPPRAGAAGVYENAAAEPAFLLSPRRIVLHADFDYAGGDDTDASIYRIGASFPLRSAFMVAIEQPFVAVSSGEAIESGIGDLWLRGSARLWRGLGRSFSLVGFAGTGTGSHSYFPYSSQTFDISTSAGYVDTLGTVTAYAIAGYAWVHREKELEAPDARHTDSWRASAGAVIGLDARSALRLGALHMDYKSGTRRDLLFAGAGRDATETLRMALDVQAEIGPESQRVSDWSASASATIRF